MTQKRKLQLSQKGKDINDDTAEFSGQIEND